MRKSIRFSVSAFVVSLCMVSIFAQGQKIELSLPQSAAAVKARAAYTNQLAKLNEEYHSGVKKVQATYLKALDVVHRDAVTKKDLEEAQRVLAVQRDLEVNEVPIRGLAILSAKWGAEDQWADFTADLAKQVQGDKLVIKNVDFAFDPKSGRIKAMHLVYAYRGKVYVKLLTQGQSLVLPDPQIRYP